MLTVLFLLALIALIATLASWLRPSERLQWLGLAVFLLCLIELLRQLPLGK